MNFQETKMTTQEAMFKALLSSVGVVDIGVCVGYRNNRARVKSFRTLNGEDIYWDVELLSLGTSAASIEHDPMGSYILTFTLRTSVKALGITKAEPDPFSDSSLKGIVVFPYGSNKDVVVGSANSEWRLQGLGYKVSYAKDGWFVETPNTRLSVTSVFSQGSLMKGKLSFFNNDEGVTFARMGTEGKVINKTLLSVDGKTSIWKFSKEPIDFADEKDDDVWLEKEEHDETGRFEVSRFNADGKLVKKSAYEVDGSEVIEWYDGNDNIVKRTTVDSTGNSNSETGKDGESNITTLIDPDGNVTIESKGEGSITFEKDMTVTIKGNVTVNIEGDCSMEVKGNVDVKGKEVNVEAQSNCNVKGTQVKVEGTQVEVTGGTLKVGGTAAPSGSGPFCGIPACLFTGAPHVGDTVAGT